MHSCLLRNGEIRWDTIWESTTGGFSVYDSRDFGRRESIFVTDEELGLFHRNLAVGIRIYEQRTSQVLGSDVNALLKLWNADIHVQLCSGHYVGLCEIKDIFVLSDTLGFSANVLPYSECSSLENRELILVPQQTAGLYVAVPHTWFDKHYPGWRLHLEIADSLGLSPNEVIKAITDVSRVADHVIPDTYEEP